MSKEYHFVVAIREDGTASIEEEMELNNGSGEVWDTETNEWGQLWDDQNYEKSQVMFATLTDLLTAHERKEK